MTGATSTPGIFAGFPIVVDATLPPNHMAIVSEGRRIVFRLDLESETAIELLDSATKMTCPEIEAWISACNLRLMDSIPLPQPISPRPQEGSTMQDDKQQDNTGETGAGIQTAVPEPLIAPAPSIGRVVWYYPGVSEKEHPSYGQPHSAQIACVHSSACVNLGIFDGNGIPYARTSVSLYHPDAVPEWQRNNGHYATWMPYQVR